MTSSATIKRKRLKERLLELPQRIVLPFLPAERAEQIHAALRRQAFTRIATEQRWGAVISGSGSTVDATIGARSIIVEVIREYRITSLLDVPCGDFGWMPLLLTEVPHVKYIGGDIVRDIIENNKRAHQEHDFRVIDFVNESLPQADLVVCRDALQHLPVSAIKKALRNFSSSGSKYLLATTHLRRYGFKNYQPCRPGSCRDRNLMLPPFGLPDPIAIYSVQFENKFLGLWRLPF